MIRIKQMKLEKDQVVDMFSRIRKNMTKMMKLIQK